MSLNDLISQLFGSALNGGSVQLGSLNQFLQTPEIDHEKELDRFHRETEIDLNRVVRTFYNPATLIFSILVDGTDEYVTGYNGHRKYLLLFKGISQVQEARGGYWNWDEFYTYQYDREGNFLRRVKNTDQGEFPQEEVDRFCQETGISADRISKMMVSPRNYAILVDDKYEFGSRLRLIDDPYQILTIGTDGFTENGEYWSWRKFVQYSYYSDGSLKSIINQKNRGKLIDQDGKLVFIGQFNNGKPCTGNIYSAKDERKYELVNGISLGETDKEITYEFLSDDFSRVE